MSQLDDVLEVISHCLVLDALLVDHCFGTPQKIHDFHSYGLARVSGDQGLLRKLEP